MRKYNYNGYLSLMLLLSGIVILSSCSKMKDNYEGFIKNGEKIYTGKADSLIALPGKNRIVLRWKLISDPKITKAKVYWNNKADSIIVPIQRIAGTQLVEVVVPNLPENAYSFQVYTFDNAGNSSVASETIGTSYGANFEGSLSNRPLDSTSFHTSNNDLLLAWFGASAQAVKVDVEYTDKQGVLQKVAIAKQPNPLNPGLAPVWFNKSTLPNYDRTKSLKYRTGYLPEAIAVDTFYTAYTEVTDIRTYVPLPPPPVDENLAKGRLVTTSGGSGTPLSDGVRSGASTKWQPSSGERGDLNVWFYVDLGSVKDFNAVQVYYSKDPNKITYYEILTSEEATIGSSTKWKRAYINFGPPEEEEIFISKTEPADPIVTPPTLINLKAKFIKINIGLRDEATNINVAEIEVYKYNEIP